MPDITKAGVLRPCFAFSFYHKTLDCPVRKGLPAIDAVWAFFAGVMKIGTELRKIGIEGFVRYLYRKVPLRDNICYYKNA